MPHCGESYVLFLSSAKVGLIELVPGADMCISPLCYIFRRSEVVYKVKKTNSVTFQRFHCLTLDVLAGGATGSITLESCLNTYFAEEVRPPLLNHALRSFLRVCDQFASLSLCNAVN
jgi:hypothetical protein